MYSLTYRLSGWIYKQATTGNAYLDLGDVAGEPSLHATSTNTWVSVSGLWNSGTYTQVVVRLVTDGGINGAVWFDEVALTPLHKVTSTAYYAAGGQTVAVRRQLSAAPAPSGAGELSYLHTDHLGSSSTTTDASGNVTARQSYYPYGGVRQQVGTLPTRRTYTGQYADDTGLMFYNARYYAPALGRFISADSIVPGAGNPQAFNRYMYVLGNPLKYTDPSGHDVMLVGGYSSNDFADPIAWREWIMTYKGWNAEQWDSYYEAWMNPRYSSAQSREYLMKHYGIYYYRWAKGDSVGTPVNLDAVASLARQMRGMNNITLIGHSKGASLVHTYMAVQAQNSAWASTYVKNFVSIKAPTNNPDIPFPLLGDRQQLVQYTISLVSGSRQPDFPSDRSNLVNIYGDQDPVSSNGYIPGATNFMSNDNQPGYYVDLHHGNAPLLAPRVFSALNVNNRTDGQSGIFVSDSWYR